MARIAKRVTLTNKQRDVLNQIITSRTHGQDHIERAKIILLSSHAKQDKQIRSELNLTQPTVSKWCNRWLKREKLADGFTKKYNVHQLVYYEVHLDVHEAILREKKIKKWHGQWKINLIEQSNPQWTNLATNLF